MADGDLAYRGKKLYDTLYKKIERPSINDIRSNVGFDNEINRKQLEDNQRHNAELVRIREQRLKKHGKGKKNVGPSLRAASSSSSESDSDSDSESSSDSNDNRKSKKKKKHKKSSKKKRKSSTKKKKSKAKKKKTKKKKRHHKDDQPTVAFPYPDSPGSEQPENPSENLFQGYFLFFCNTCFSSFVLLCSLSLLDFCLCSFCRVAEAASRALELSLKKGLPTPGSGQGQPLPPKDPSIPLETSSMTLLTQSAFSRPTIPHTITSDPSKPPLLPIPTTMMPPPLTNLPGTAPPIQPPTAMVFDPAAIAKARATATVTVQQLIGQAKQHQSAQQHKRTGELMAHNGDEEVSNTADKTLARENEEDSTQAKKRRRKSKWD
eukprot:m.177831 g.177831  ORF g.177831 m.177831 type:complete len:377 (+) comp25349_c0_seq5:991-2121(+)